MSSDRTWPRWRRLREWTERVWLNLQPAANVRKGASLGIVVLASLVTVAIGGAWRIGLWFFDPIVGAALALAFTLLIGLGIVLVIKLLAGLPRFLTWGGIAAAGVFIIFMFLMRFPPLAALGLGLGIVMLEAIFGGGLAFLFSGGLRSSPTSIKAWVSVALLAGVMLNGFLFYWLAGEGSDDHLTSRPEVDLDVSPLEAPDPSQPGRYPVLSLTYGSGTNRRRPEFAEEADLETEPVDGSPFVKGSEGLRAKIREWYWGFDFEHFPVNGRVWYPDGKGPFPLILIVHGNHDMAEFSDPGYSYLGELFASRGFITVSVDENFLNASWVGNLETENDARGWMMLQHLAVWRKWNQIEDNPFFEKVDLENIGLIGHSRGGEAVAIAGAFNRLRHYPDDATVEFDFDFGIRAIIAIAPVDGQYKPAGRPTPLKNLNYLVLHGAHDADVSSFAGARQYKRVLFDDDGYWFKTSLYAYRANHGQFNTVWGRTDAPSPIDMLLNLEPLMEGEEQRRIGRIYMSGFLEATLHRDSRYIPLFRDHRRAATWLPEGIYINRFEDSCFQSLASYEEDVDVTTASLESVMLHGEGLAVWREQDLELRRRGTKENQVAYVGWRRIPDQQTVPSYSVSLSQEVGSALGRDSLLVVSLAEADEKPPTPDDDDEGEEKEEEDQDEGEKKPLELTVELVAVGGETVRFPLSLPPPLVSKFTKLWNEEHLYGDASEPALQTFELPFSSFTTELPTIELATIRFLFDRAPEGVVIIDDIGLSRQCQSGSSPANR